ncbi:hypothetical protein P2318_00185 [Myxococcaceae bacterium GXIMD 01537]
MPNRRHALWSLSAAVVLSAAPALADWEADLQMKPQASPMGGAPTSELKGKAHGRQSMLRMDVQSPQGPMGMLINWDKHQVTVLMPAHKMAIQRDTSQDSDIPSCGVKDIDKCLASKGFKKAGSETVNGHPCIVYEKDAEGSTGPVKTKVWRPKDLEEVPFVRSESSNTSGVLSLINLTNVTTKSQPDSHFAVPAGYRVMQSSGAGASAAGPGAAPFNPADMKGKTPEQMRELLKQHLERQTGATPAGK